MYYWNNLLTYLLTTGCPEGTWGVDCLQICNCANVNTPCNASTGCTECALGYVDTGNCTQDIDECLQNICESDATCNNTIGSFKCVCPVGKLLLNATHCYGKSRMTTPQVVLGVGLTLGHSVLILLVLYY